MGHMMDAVLRLQVLVKNKVEGLPNLSSPRQNAKGKSWQIQMEKSTGIFSNVPENYDDALLV